MTHPARKIIIEEHAALAAMLRSLLLLLGQCRRQHKKPDLLALRSMLFYVDEFPEKRHHPLESQLLFPKVRARAPQVRDILDRLEDDHARSERRVRDLEHALLAFEVMGESHRDAFESFAKTYVDSYLHHMAMEEQHILPLADRVLTEQDWKELDEAFLANQDPLTGHTPDDDFRELFTRIVNLVPAPVGLGA